MPGTLRDMAKTAPDQFVLRPFEHLPGEPDWVALREIVPTATAQVRTTAAHADRPACRAGHPRRDHD